MANEAKGAADRSVFWQGLFRRGILALSMLGLACGGWAVRAAESATSGQGTGPVAFHAEPIAHRGAAFQAPENTWAALERCVEDGCRWVEVDVRRTADGRHVLWHDGSLQKAGRGDLRLDSTAWVTLAEVDVGEWFAPRFRGQRLLTLEEALGRAKGKLGLLLDCKDVDPAVVVRLVRAAGMERDVLIYDTPAQLGRWRSLTDGALAVMTQWRAADGLKEGAVGRGPDAVEIDAPEVTPEGVAFWHARGVRVEAKCLGAWDVTTEHARVAAAGVDWIQTDFPEEVLAARLLQRPAQRPVQISLHRGANRYAPENTLEAFSRGARLGADYVEIDVRTTTDGQWFLLHDSRLDRTTDGKGPIAERTGEEIRALSAGRWFGLPFASSRVPSMDEFLSAVPGGVQVYFDAKAISPEALVAGLRRHRMEERTVVYQEAAYLLRLKSLSPVVRTLPPLRDPGELPRLASELGPYAVDVAWDRLSKELIDACHARGIRVFSDALGGNLTPSRYREVIEWGIDLIQTDHPLHVLRRIREK